MKIRIVIEGGKINQRIQNVTGFNPAGFGIDEWNFKNLNIPN